MAWNIQAKRAGKWVTTGSNYFLLRGLFSQFASIKKHSRPKSRMTGVADFMVSPWG
jgi:hypothetical protein